MKTPPAPANAAATFRDLCERCHGEKGDGSGKVAWYLDPSPRDFTKAGFMVSKPRQRFVNSIKEGVPGTSMPPWGRALKDDQVDGVLSYVLKTFARIDEPSPRNHNVPDRNPVATSAASIGRGEHTFLERCTGCHGRKADGKGPNSLDIFPHPRNLRNSWFVAKVEDRRLFDSILYGVQGTAMPSWIDYGLSKEDVGDIINFIRSLSAQRSDLHAAN